MNEAGGTEYNMKRNPVNLSLAFEVFGHFGARCSNEGHICGDCRFLIDCEIESE